MPAERALRNPAVSFATLRSEGQLASLSISEQDGVIDAASLEIELKYEGYLKRQVSAVERQRKQGSPPYSRMVPVRRDSWLVE